MEVSRFCATGIISVSHFLVSLQTFEFNYFLLPKTLNYCISFPDSEELFMAVLRSYMCMSTPSLGYVSPCLCGSGLISVE